MIKEVKGDILLSDAQNVAHCVAPLDHFDSGLALSLREQYPAMVKDFRHYCHTHSPKPGNIWAWAGVGGKRIVNLMAQEPVESKHNSGHPGKASISDLDHCLKELSKFIDKENIENIAIPKLATGVGGLKWDDVESLINKRLGDSMANIYLYTQYVKDVKAEEV
jgi:O-acetyl-ADP-ribose deacetylase (regulator of RNase III)